LYIFVLANNGKDDFTRKLDTEWPEFKSTEEGMLVMELLKVFDRGFWLKHFKELLSNSEEEIFKPHDCPFGGK
jgi:hypothetical protein